VATVCGFGFVAVRGELRKPSLSDWRLVAVSGVLQMATYSALTAVALTRLPPGRASVLGVLDAAVSRAALGVVAG
jgi:drug/metabolite transporter (DMT)-like permease